MPSMWVIVYNASGTQVGGLRDIVASRTTRGVGRIGSMEVVIPATSREAAYVDVGYEVHLYYSEATTNPRFRGRIESVSRGISADGVALLVFEGPSLGIELVDYKTYLGVEANDLSVSDAVDALIDGTSWTKTVTGSGFVDLTTRWSQMSIWEAMTWLADQQSGFIRETYTSRQIEISRSTAATGITLRNPAVVPDSLDPAVGIIKSIGSVRKDTSHIVNRIIPQGLDAGNLVYDLEQSDRSSPYTIQSILRRAAVVDAIDTSVTGSGGLFPDTVNMAGSDRAVILFIRVAESQAFQIVECNGRSMRELASPASTGGSTYLHVWGAFGVPEGRAAVRALHASFASGVNAIIISLRNVLQSDPIRGTATASGSSTSATVNISSNADDLVIDGVISAASVLDSGPGAGQTEVANNQDFLVSSIENGGTTVTMSWTLSSSGTWRTVAIALRSTRVYYIEDSTSIAAYGGPNDIPRIEMLTEPARQLVGASVAELTNAANTMYDYAAARLTRLKDPITYYRDVRVELGADDWLPGDSFEMRFAGFVDDVDGRRAWLTVDDTLYVLEASENFDGADGVRTWSLDLATAYEWPHDDASKFAESRRNGLSTSAVVVKG